MLPVLFGVMPSGLHRSYGAHHLHIITCSCYRRLPLLRTARSRDRFLAILEQTRGRYRFVVVGYVVMPEHIPPDARLDYPIDLREAVAI
jgi:REP-associated tyrosine transposase